MAYVFLKRIRLSVQQFEILFSGNSERVEDAFYDRNWELGTFRDDNRPDEAGFGIRAMAAFLSGESQPHSQDHFFQFSPVNWSQTRQVQSSRAT